METKTLYLRQQGSAWDDEIPVTAEITPIPRKGQTVTGYGRTIPTRYMVKYNGRRFRVKCAIWGNIGTCYIGKPRAWLAVVED